ncbi:MAG TPA: hypothetical protein VHT74_22915 [Acetobacteraceae bacterium]|jgi:hypothetical protein|nr:hypothetical protein [Acetobacteraceae bacterium]
MYHFGWLFIALLVMSCAPDSFDPYQRPGTWNPAGDNDANLPVMLVNTHDLIEGAGQGATGGAEAAAPVARVLAGKTYPLPQLSTTPIGGTSQPQQQGTANPSPNQ